MNRQSLLVLFTMTHRFWVVVTFLSSVVLHFCLGIVIICVLVLSVTRRELLIELPLVIMTLHAYLRAVNVLATLCRIAFRDLVLPKYGRMNAILGVALLEFARGVLIGDATFVSFWAGLAVCYVTCLIVWHLLTVVSCF